MNHGAIALIDALGFKGIWKRQNPELVLGVMKEIRSLLEGDLHQIAEQPDMQFRSAFLSDTVALALSLPPDREHREALSICYVADILTRVLKWAATAKVPLAFRGAISYGPFEIDSHLLIGSAVDDAAELYELSQGALIWLAPTARDHVSEWLKPRPTNTHLVKFDVPLKNGASFSTYTVSPLVQTADASEAVRVSNAILSTCQATAIIDPVTPLKLTLSEQLVL